MIYLGCLIEAILSAKVPMFGENRIWLNIEYSNLSVKPNEGQPNKYIPIDYVINKPSILQKHNANF